jgi:hypothetical protein
MLHQTVRTWPRCFRIVMALVRLYRTQARNNGADALGNAVAPCQTVGSPVAPPEALQPKMRLPLRRAPGLHSFWAAMAASAAGECAVGGDAPEWHSPGTRAVLQGAHRPNLGTVGGDGVRRQSEFRSATACTPYACAIHPFPDSAIRLLSSVLLLSNL